MPAFFVRDVVLKLCSWHDYVGIHSPMVKRILVHNFVDCSAADALVDRVSNDPCSQSRHRIRMAQNFKIWAYNVPLSHGIGQFDDFVVHGPRLTTCTDP